MKKKNKTKNHPYEKFVFGKDVAHQMKICIIIIKKK